MASLVIDIVTEASKAIAGLKSVGDEAKTQGSAVQNFGTQASDGLKSVGTEAKKQGSAVQTFGGKAKGAFSGVTTSMTAMGLGGLGAAGAITLVAGALMDASKAAREDEKSQKLLETAMRNNLNATTEQVASMEDWIDKTARATGVADDQLRPALQNLIIAGQDAATAQESMGIALDIAAAKGLDVETVTKAMAKAYGGNMGALSKLGIQVKDADGKTVSFDEAMQNAADTMGGSAAAAALTLEGQMERLTIKIDEAKESVGGFVNTGLANLVTGAEVMGLSFALATEDLDAATASTNALQQAGSNLLHLGIDPMTEKGDLLAISMGFLANAGELDKESFDELLKVIKPTTGEIQKAMDATDDFNGVITVGTDDIAGINAELENYQTTAQAAAEDARFLSGRYTHLATEADKAREKAAAYREELVKQGDEMRKLTDPVFALRDAQRQYNAAFEKWSDLAVTGTANADELTAAEDDLTEASLDLEAAELAAENGGKKMKDAWNAARAEAGLLTDATYGSKEAIDQWSAAVNNAPRWHPGTGTGGGPVPLQAGGPVVAGGMYTVGEAGRELFLPGVSGMIVPHGQTEQILKRSPEAGGGGSSYTLNMYPRKADAADVAWGFRRLELARTGR